MCQKHQPKSYYNTKAGPAIGQDVFAIGFENERIGAPTRPQEVITENRQFEALERVLDEGRDCSEVLQIISAARGAVNSLMTELLEGHIRHHVLDPKRKPNSEQTMAADEVIDMVKTYLR